MFERSRARAITRFVSAICRRARGRTMRSLSSLASRRGRRLVSWLTDTTTAAIAILSRSDGSIVLFGSTASRQLVVCLHTRACGYPSPPPDAWRCRRALCRLTRSSSREGDESCVEAATAATRTAFSAPHSILCTPHCRQHARHRLRLPSCCWSLHRQRADDVLRRLGCEAFDWQADGASR